MGEKNHIEIRWIKAHVGHPGNELADDMAKEGAEDTENPVEDVPKMPRNIARNTIRRKCVEIWNEWWQDSPHYRQTKLFLPEIDKTKALDFTKGRRNIFSAVVQFITGFNFLNYHQDLVDKGMGNDMTENNNDEEPMEPIDRSLCRFCKSGPESTFHMLTVCDKHAIIRFLLWGQESLQPPYKITSNQI